jgi:glycine/D-amino acid oxidase-like deaminating enzyme
VIGAGVAGLASALRLQIKHPRWRVVALGDEDFEDTTTAGAAGVWGPYKLSDTPPELVVRWSRETYAHLLEIAHSPEAADAGVSRSRAVTLRTKAAVAAAAAAASPLPYWADAVGGVSAFSRVPPEELELFSSGFVRAAGAEGLPPLPPQLCRFSGDEEEELRAGTLPFGPDPHAAPFVEGFTWPTLVCEGRFYLSWLARRLRAAGGSLRRHRVASVATLASGTEAIPPPPPEEEEAKEQQRQSSCRTEGFDLIVDAAGLRAPLLFPDDAKNVYPIRGHVLRVKAPWIREALFAESGHNDGTGIYILPNRDFVVVGGTGGIGDGDRNPRPKERAAILRAALALAPSLARAEPVGEWIGLRPGRTRARVGETEMVALSEGGGKGEGGGGGGGGGSVVPVVHCYGHGGSGLTLAWGCAGDVVEAVERALL